MMSKLIHVALIFLPTFAISQSRFSLNSVVGDSLVVQINGRVYSLSDEPVLIKTHHPLFDTLRFLNDGYTSNEPIICNFKPDSSYSIVGACCASLDIIPTSKLNDKRLEDWSNDYETNFEQIQEVLMDKPFISLRITQDYGDTIYGWYADLACFSQFKKLSPEKWEYGIPQKCFYWNNVSPFIFFTSSIDYLTNETGIVEDFPAFETIEILGEIHLRLFDDERFILTFDPNTNKTALTYE